MAGNYPTIIYTEEGMREGMQIEAAEIPVSAKVELLDPLSETGLKRIVVGSFVSPKYTPQMARIDEIVRKFHPKPCVTYTALALNPNGRELAARYAAPFTLSDNSSRPRPPTHRGRGSGTRRRCRPAVPIQGRPFECGPRAMRDRE